VASPFTCRDQSGPAGSTPNISRGEHVRQTRLEEKRQPPLCALEIAAHRIERHGGAGEDKTPLVKLHAAAQPFGVRIGPMKRNSAGVLSAFRPRHRHGCGPPGGDHLLPRR
jgi:hypothetical protein